MEIRKRDLLAAGVGLGAGLVANGALAQTAGRGGEGGEAAGPAAGRGAAARADTPVSTGTQPSTVDMNYKPRRVNKGIELLEDGQPIYYTDVVLGHHGVDPYAMGVKMAHTWADAVNISMEHDSTLDFTGLRAFVQGLVDGGPTRSGHRTPMLSATTPISGWDEAFMRANIWVISSVLDCGIMDISLTHARDPKAVQVASQMAMRYPFDYPNTPKLPMEGRRGSSASFAAQAWGVSPAKYVHIADLWPLNPRGEMLFGLKLEDKYADVTAAQSLALPGIAYAEYGGGDQHWSLNGLAGIPEDGTRVDIAALPDMIAWQKTMQDLCRKNKVMYLGTGDVIEQIKDGVKIIGGREAEAIRGREYTKRKMPV